MGLKTRKKKRTRFQPVSDAQKIKNEIASKLPRILVVNRGNVSPATRHLMQDVKDMFSPHIIQTIKVLRNHKLTDLAKGAKELDLRHCLLFSQTDVGLYMKVATMPDGPTITFRITEYTLSGDIKSTQKKPISLSEMALYSPAALIMNNISPQSGPKHLQAMASSIQMMFAKFSPEHVTTAAIKRTCMFNYNAAEDEMEVRHYAIKLGASSDNKFLKRIANGNKIPNLNKLKNIDEAMDKVGLLSESEGEEDIKVEVTEDSKANVKDDKSKVKASLPAPKTVEKSLRLKDVGPRMSWQLVKIESGFMAGDVVYHKTETRTKEAKEDRNARRDQIKTEKKLRREQQEANVQRKLDLAEAHRQRCIAGMKPTGEEADSEHETSDEEAKQDDEAKYYAEEVGEEPSADLAARMTLTRKDKPQENWEEEVSKKKAQEEEKWDERRKQLKAKYRKLDAKRKTNKPRSFKKRLARKIKSEVKDRNAHKESEKRKREAEETAPTIQKSNKKAKK